MRTTALLVGLLLSISMACLGPNQKANFEASLNRWVGRPISAFINANRLPDAISDRAQGGKIYVFEASHSVTETFKYTEYTNFATGQRAELGAGSQPPTWMSDGGAQRVQVNDKSITVKPRHYCRVILETDAREVIQSVRYEGNDCW